MKLFTSAVNSGSAATAASQSLPFGASAHRASVLSTTTAR